MKFRIGDRVQCLVWDDGQEELLGARVGTIAYIDEVTRATDPYLVDMDVHYPHEEDELWYGENELELLKANIADGQLQFDIPVDEWEAEMVNDNVNHPKHYTTGKIETKDLYRLMLTDEECRGGFKMNVIKYLTRYQHKNGVEDLRKAMKYIEFLIELEEEHYEVL